MVAPKHVAIVGCGFTGASALHQLVARYPVERVTVFEASGCFGPGFPYQVEDSPDYLLNNTTDTMCLAPDDRGAFLRWLSKQPHRFPDVDPGGHLPRTIYGEFLIDSVRRSCSTARDAGIQVELIAEEVTALREDTCSVWVESTSGTIEADVALLTTGRCAPRDRIPRPPSDGDVTLVRSHIMNDALDGLPSDAEVYVLGASLSAYDVVNRLFSPATGCSFRARPSGDLDYHAGANARRLVLCSRTGRLKSVQSRQPQMIARTAFLPKQARGVRRLADIAQLIQTEAIAHEANIDWDEVIAPYANVATVDQLVARASEWLDATIERAATGNNFLVDLLADAQIDIWDTFAERTLPVAEEVKYRAEVETAFQSYAAPCPLSTARRLAALVRAGRLTFRHGVKSVELACDASHYAVHHANGIDEARILIDATGSVDKDVDSPAQSALYQDLVAHGLVRPHRRDSVRLGGIAVDMTTFRALGATRIFVANMFLWGPGFFTSSAFMMATVVSRILDRLFGPKSA